MEHNLGKEKINTLLWQLSIPAMLGMLSSAIFNIVDRIFVGRIQADALTAIGITMPVQVLQMALVLLVGIGTSTLISIRLGEGKKEEAEDILFLALKYIIIFLIGFAVIFFLFADPILSLLSVPKSVLPSAKLYIQIIIAGSIIGIPGYCLNNSLRSIGQAKTSMNIVIISSILNMILDPIFIFGFNLGIAGAAIATVLSQFVLTVYVIYSFCKNKEFLIHLSYRKVKHEGRLLKECLKLGRPSFYVQLLATVVNIFINHSFLQYGTKLDIAAVTIMSSLFSFYHMVVFGLVQGNNAICGYNWGAKQYKRVRQSLRYSLRYAFMLSLILFLVIQLFPHALVDMFTKEQELADVTAAGIKIYLSMLPLLGLQTISSQYFQAVGKAKTSSILSFLRYGIIVVPSILLLAPVLGVNGIYISNAISDGVASVVAIAVIMVELKRLRTLERTEVVKAQ